MTPRGGYFRSAGRLAGLALALAAGLVATLGVFIASDLKREAELHREVIAVQEIRDALDRLRLALAELRNGARLAALTGDPVALQEIERRAGEVDADLALVSRHLGAGEPFPFFQDLVPAARLLAIQARSIQGIRETRGPDAAMQASVEAATLADRAVLAAGRARGELARRLNDRTLDRIRIGENIRSTLAWLLAGAAVVMVALFAAYRRARRREAEALHRVEWLAHWDTVTGLPNRALLSERLSQELARAQRAGVPLALVMFDLDGFKAVNDTFGHPAGDRLLKLVGERCRANVRISDTIGRLSGDEFLAILPEAGAEHAAEVAEKLRAALVAPYAVDGGEARVTASFGIAAFPMHGDDPDALSRAADAALYDAKRAGKNRVYVAPTAAAPSRETADA